MTDCYSRATLPSTPHLQRGDGVYGVEGKVTVKSSMQQQSSKAFLQGRVCSDCVDWSALSTALLCAPVAAGTHSMVCINSAGCTLPAWLRTGLDYMYGKTQVAARHSVQFAGCWFAVRHSFSGQITICATTGCDMPRACCFLGSCWV